MSFLKRGSSSNSSRVVPVEDFNIDSKENHQVVAPVKESKQRIINKGLTPEYRLFKYPNGDIYDGNRRKLFQLNKIRIYSISCDRICFVGMWLDGKRDGKGKYIFTRFVREQARQIDIWHVYPLTLL